MQSNPTKPFDEKAYMKEYAAKNREKIAVYQRRWRQENREKREAYAKTYYEANREAQSAKAKQYYAENKAAIIERVARNYRANPRPTIDRATEWNRKNPDKKRASNAKWGKINLDKKRASCKRFREKYPEYHKQRLKAWNEANRDKVIAYRKANAERTAERQRKWHQEHPERARLTQSRRRSRMTGAGGTYTENDIAVMYDQQAGLCAGCSKDLNQKYEIDHIVPVLLGGSSWPDNLQLLCRTCNRSKGHKHPDKWFAELKRPHKSST